jgi:hypothetical protein
MPTLNWIGRKAVENHHRQVPFHLLREVPDLCVGDPGTGNLLLEADNLRGLKALLPYFAEHMKRTAVQTAGRRRAQVAEQRAAAATLRAGGKKPGGGLPGGSWWKRG